MRLDEIFAEEKIEYFSVVDYSECLPFNKRLAISLPFVPRSVIVYLLPYYTGKTENISLYSASLDYHIIIGEIQERIIEKLKKLYPVSSFEGFTDHSPINEIAAAVKARLGAVGDNGLLLNEKYGSFVFLADILTDIPCEELISNADRRDMPQLALCTHCGRCKAACPTGVLRGESSDCLSAITQRRGELSEAEKKMMRKFNTAWGCDICQTSCPVNKCPVLTPIDAFWRDRISFITYELLSSMSDEEFAKRAYAWRGRRTVLRNLEILTADTGSDAH